MNARDAEQLIAILGQHSPLALLPDILSVALALHADVLLAQPKHQDPRSLARARAQVCSQNGEDGVIAEIFRRVGTEDGSGTGCFVEIGAGNGDQNNTRFLLETGWRGIWWEAGENNVATIRETYAAELADGRLTLIDSMVTRENVQSGLDAAGCAPVFDLLSLDVDMNTSHVWRALAGFKPRVAVIEYNPALGPVIDWEVEYRPDAVWPGDNRFGASLKRLERIGRELGYALVGCELTGINAYFVRKDLVNDEKFQPPFSAMFHHEAPRFGFLAASMGHPPAARARPCH